jgi:hypothetical protein
MRIFYLTLLTLAAATPASASDIRAEAAFALAGLEAGLDPSTCAADLNAYTKRLALDPSRLPRNHKDLLESLWGAKLALRARLRELDEAGRNSPACVAAARRFFLAGRALEDYVGEQLVRPAPFDKKRPPLALTGGFPHLMLSPKAGSRLELRSGDVLLSRGSAYTSAAIARVTDVPAQFSHNAILHIDASGRKWIVQSLIENGAMAIPFEKYATTGHARVYVARHPDAALAASAAKKIFDLVTRATATRGNIPYDFKVNEADPSELFCTELIAYAFKLASRGQVKVPLYSSGINMRNRDFLDAVGISPRRAFMPGDLEVDSRFELIAEWRDYSQVGDIRRDDAILDKQFEWMERKDYVHAPQFTTSLLKHLVYNLRHGPLQGLVDGFLPENMSRRTLGAVVSLFLASGPMGSMLKDEDKRALRAGRLPLSTAELKSRLEAFRAEDEKAFRESQEWERYGRMSGGDGGQPMTAQPQFHHYFRPRSLLN